MIKKKKLIPLGTGVIGLILGILSYIFYEPNIVILIALIVLGILVGFRLIREKPKKDNQKE